MIGIDSNVFIYILEDNLEFSAPAQRAISQTVQSGKSLGVSVLVITEILSGTNNPNALEFLEASHATQYEFTKAIAVVAGNLRRQHKGLKTADAIHIATALIHGADSFITNDKKLLNLKLEIEMIPLMSFDQKK